MNTLRVKEPTTNSQGETVFINVDGMTIKGFTSESISVALYANDIKSFDRSKKLYRARGFFSLHPQARTAMVNVNGMPAMNPSEIYLTEGLKVRTQQKRPLSIRFFESMIDTSLIHKSFVKNRLIWSLALKFIANNINNPEPVEYKIPHTVSTIVEKADLVVVGGGVAGLSAAIEARKYGLEVLQIDDGVELGGEMLYDELEPPGMSEPGCIFVRNLRKKALELGVKLLSKTTFIGFFEDAALAFSPYPIGNGTPYIISAKTYVVATGAVDLPCIFANNDLPGIIDTSSALRMLNMHGVIPGKSVAILGATLRGLRLAEHLKKHAVKVIVLDKSRGDSDKSDIMHGVKEIIAVGKDRVKALKVKRDGEELKLNVDCVVCAASTNPDIKVSAQAGAKITYIKELGFVTMHDPFMRTSKSGLFVAGGASGSPYGILHVVEGRIAGLSAAIELAKRDAEAEREALAKEYRSLLQKFGISDSKEKLFKSFETGIVPDEKIAEPPTLFCSGPRRDAFICFCEDIRLWDLHRSVSVYGFKCLEKVKRSTGIGTARCQGRLCLVNSALYIAYVSDLSPNAVGMARQRPPTISMPINVLASMEVNEA
ncbi:MAG: FAD-dependent oxidoreductase [Nitrososphaerota archaeon]|nr:FAD-dependent oxidoreductase [Aigarchaeota archaeon]MDW8076608.1 FAD-dependent oxidoreductase [Nitrososphaerota archaeon]